MFHGRMSLPDGNLPVSFGPYLDTPTSFPLLQGIDRIIACLPFFGGEISLRSIIYEHALPLLEITYVSIYLEAK